MKVLLQQTTNSWFCVNSLRWAPQVEDAFDFADPEVALGFMREKNLQTVKVIYLLDDGSFSIPVGCPSSIGETFVLGRFF